MLKHNFLLSISIFLILSCFSAFAQDVKKENSLDNGSTAPEIVPEDAKAEKPKQIGFNEYIFSTAAGMNTGFEILKMDDKEGSYYSLGPSIKFDMNFSLNSGFSFLILSELDFPFIFNTLDKQVKGESEAPFFHFGTLFGYTYGVKKDLEFTAAAGIGIMYIIPELIFQFNMSKFFSEKYGIYFTLNDKLVVVPPTLAQNGKIGLANFSNISLGASFRVIPKQKMPKPAKLQEPQKKKIKKRLFEQYVFAPSVSVSSLFLGIPPNNDAMPGPSLALDMIFTKAKSGFSFFIHNNNSFWFYLPKDRIEHDSSFVFPISVFHFMFGYTHGRGSSFEVSAGIGPCIAFLPTMFFIPAFPPALSAELSFIKYFNEKCGIYFSVLNSLTLVPFGVSIDKKGKRSHGLLFVDMLNINIGHAFKL